MSDDRDDPHQDPAPESTDAIVERFLQQLPIHYPFLEPQPSRSLLTRPVATRIVRALKAGHSHKTAAQLAGISPATLKTWLDKGDTEDATDQTRDYIAFRCAVLAAEANAEDLALRSVLAAGAKDWKAPAWWLSRRHHQDWAERSREGESGRSGVVINVGIALAPGQAQPQAIEASWVSVPTLPPPDGTR